MKAKNPCEKPGFLIRYAAPIVVAFSFSFITLLVGFMAGCHVVPVNFLSSHPEAADFILFAPVGFVGVLSGTFCLEQSRRRYGSVVLLGLGLGFSNWLWFWPDWFESWPLVIGGLVPVIFFRFKSRKSSQPV